MNVYLYQNNTEKILKNAYIGEYKTYSVDFTTATAASLQQDWFTTYGNLGLDSNWMYVSSWDNAECWVYKAVDLTWCSKFTLKFYSSLTSWSWAGWPNLWIWAISWSSFTSPYSWLNFRSNNNSWYCGEQLFYENSIIAQNTTAKSNWDYTTTIVYDFSNSTVSVTTTWPTPASYSANLSSAQVSALTQNRYIKYWIWVWWWSAGRYNRLKKVERIIE